MDIKNRYVESIKKLFPQGDYWDAVFAHANGDIPAISKLFSVELERFIARMRALQSEAFPLQSDELLSRWEQVLLGKTNETLDKKQRLDLLLVQKSGVVTKESIVALGKTYGVAVKKIIHPYRPACFAHTRFGVDRLANLATFSLLLIEADICNKDFETAATTILLANYTIFFNYGGA